MFGDEDHSHPALAVVTLLNTLLLVGLIAMLLSAGLINPRDAPLIGSFLPDRERTGSAAMAAGRATAGTLGTTSPRPAATRVASAPGASARSEFLGGESVVVGRGAEFRSAGDLRLDSFCALMDDTPGTVLRQEPARSVDRAGRPRTVYPIAVRDASCRGGVKVDELRGWVSDEFLRRP